MRKVRRHLRSSVQIRTLCVAGYNDYWNLIGLNQLKSPVKDLKIYDRFGKILKQLTTNSQGWDGSYNDKIMPSDDYWYTIELQNGKVIKGHFALKR